MEGLKVEEEEVEEVVRHSYWKEIEEVEEEVDQYSC